FDIGSRVDAVGHVHDIAVFEAAHDVGDGVGLADVGEELVAQTFTLGGSRHQAGDIDKLHGGGEDALRLHDLRQHVQAGVGHGHQAGVRLDGAEGEVLGCDASLGQRIEKCGLADVGKTDNAAFDTHDEIPGKNSVCYHCVKQCDKSAAVQAGLVWSSCSAVCQVAARA